MALFDYDPPTMSPNPEACDEELPFREGQLIKVCKVKAIDRLIGKIWSLLKNQLFDRIHVQNSIEVALNQ